jgi:microsomal dipeptidase-like Zn-dependent dipeptidase
MDNEKIVAQWHAKIRDVCERKLQRQLSDVEHNFVFSRQGFVALEMIQDTVVAMPPEKLQAYLKAEIGV